MMEQDMQQILFTQDQVAARVQELAAQITRDYAGNPPWWWGVLRGSFIFMADLVRHLDLPSPWISWPPPPTAPAPPAPDWSTSA